MPAAHFIPGGNYRTTPAILADTNEATIFTAPDGAPACSVVNMRFTDDGGSARTVTVVMRRSGTDYVIVYQGAIPANAPLSIDDLFVLNRGDSIKATASAGGVHCFVSFESVARGVP